jgi:plastocyanin
MIWRLVTCFSLGAVALQATTVSGRIALSDSRVDAVNKRQDYSGIVVYLQQAPLTVLPPAALPALPQPVSRHVVMLQKNKMFTPHVLPILAGTWVDFPNADPIFHNAFSSFNGQIFDVGLYPPGTSKSVQFTRQGVVRVFCNIHPSMSAIILVLGTPYFTTTAKDGSFQMEVPPGSYDLNVFHERAAEQTLQELSRRVLATGQAQRLQPIMVSEAGYLLSPHKNKYGKEYAPPPDDQIVYPGVRN